jgi:hypothetical protein
MESSRKSKAPAELTIKRAANGAFIVKHHFDNSGAGESYRSPEEHAFSGHKAMMAHVHTHTSMGKDEGAEADTGPAPKVEKAPAKGTGVGKAPAKGKAPGPKSVGAGLD